MQPARVIPLRRGHQIRARKQRKGDRPGILQRFTAWATAGTNRGTLLLAGVVAGIVAGAIVAFVILAMHSANLAAGMAYVE